MANIIYIRTSTKEQTPELQINKCKELINKLGFEDNSVEVISDKQSAFKDNVEREGFQSLKKRIKKREIKNLIVWHLDRLYRNRKRLISFFGFCKIYNCKIYSHQQGFLEEINKAPEPWNEIVFNLMLEIIGWMAEDESKTKSNRIKNAIRKENGKTKSYKGNKWGRKEIYKNKKLVESVLKVKKENPDMPIKKICSKVYYYDKNNNKKNPSTFVVWKILSS